MMLMYACLLETRGSALGLLKNLYAGCLSLSSGISLQFTLEMCMWPKIAKNSLKTTLLAVQGRSRSSMLINLKSLSPVLVTISSMSVPSCNRFCTKRANSGKIMSFRWVLLFDGLVQKEPPHLGTQNFVMKN